MKEEEVGVSCDVRVEDFFYEHLKERDHLQDISIDERILKWVLNRMRWIRRDQVNVFCWNLLTSR
jgi:hypothetical protein